VSTRANSSSASKQGVRNFSETRGDGDRTSDSKVPTSVSSYDKVRKESTTVDSDAKDSSS